VAGIAELQRESLAVHDGDESDDTATAAGIEPSKAYR